MSINKNDAEKYTYLMVDSYYIYGLDGITNEEEILKKQMLDESHKSNLLENGWERVDVESSEITGAEEYGYYASAYKNINTGEVIIVHRGSDDLKDWILNNTKLGLDEIPPQVHIA